MVVKPLLAYKKFNELADDEIEIKRNALIRLLQN